MFDIAVGVLELSINDFSSLTFLDIIIPLSWIGDFNTLLRVNIPLLSVLPIYLYLSFAHCGYLYASLKASAVKLKRIACFHATPEQSKETEKNAEIYM